MGMVTLCSFFLLPFFLQGAAPAKFLRLPGRQRFDPPTYHAPDLINLRDDKGELLEADRGIGDPNWGRAEARPSESIGHPLETIDPEQPIGR